MSRYGRAAMNFTVRGSGSASPLASQASALIRAKVSAEASLSRSALSASIAHSQLASQQRGKFNSRHFDFAKLLVWVLIVFF